MKRALYIRLASWLSPALLLCQCAQQDTPVDPALMSYQARTTSTLSQMAGALDRNFQRYSGGQTTRGVRGVVTISSSASGPQTSYASSVDAAKACLTTVTSIQATAQNWSLMANTLSGCLTRILAASGGVNTVAFNHLTTTGQGLYLYSMDPTQPLSHADISSHLANVASSGNWEGN